MTEKINVLYKPVGKSPIEKNVKNMYLLKKKIVQNDLQMKRFGNAILIFEIQKQNSNYVPNLVFSFENIAGDVFVIGYNPNNKDFRRLNSEEINYYSRLLESKSFNYNNYKKWLKKRERRNSKENERNDVMQNKTSNSEKERNLISNEVFEKVNTQSSNEEIELILKIQTVILNYINKKTNENL